MYYLPATTQWMMIAEGDLKSMVAAEISAIGHRLLCLSTM